MDLERLSNAPVLGDGSLLRRHGDSPGGLGELLRRHGGAPVELGLRAGRGGGDVQVLAHLLLLAHAVKVINYCNNNACTL